MVRNEEIFLIGAHISPLTAASTHVRPDPVRTRKLLLHAEEIRRLIGRVDRAGYTLVPLDNSKAATEALNAGDTQTDTLTVSSVDGTASQTITVTIHGTNDAATITSSATEDASVTEAGAGNATTAATPGDATAGGTLTVHDVDAGQAHFAAVAPAALAGTYGNFSFDSATGVWGYTLDNCKAATQALPAAAPFPYTPPFRSVDGTASQTITVTIHGTNDAATI